MNEVNEELQAIKQHVTEIRGKVDTGDPVVFLNVALTRDQIQRWLEETQERIRILKEILAELEVLNG